MADPTCPNCGKTISTEGSFCPHCGCNLKSASTADNSVCSSAESVQTPPPCPLPPVPNDSSAESESLQLNDTYLEKQEDNDIPSPPELVPNNEQPQRTKKKGLIIAIIIIVVLMCIAAAVWYFGFYTRDNDQEDLITPAASRNTEYVNSDISVNGSEEVVLQATVKPMPPLTVFVNIPKQEEGKPQRLPHMKTKQQIRDLIESEGFELVSSETNPIEGEWGGTILIYTSKFERKEPLKEDEDPGNQAVNRIVLSDRGPVADDMYAMQITFAKDEDLKAFLQGAEKYGFKLDNSINLEGYDFYCFKGHNDYGDLYLAVKGNSVEISLLEP